MKLLLVAIPNHHFFQWVNQLKDSGYEVHWFDVTDGGDFVERISWVHQIKNWKLRIKFPFRHYIKKHFPSGYAFIQKANERNCATVFEKHLLKIQPDIVHCFEMKLSGFPILKVMERNQQLPFVYSSWGSDLFSFTALGVSNEAINRFLSRANYLITDCKRDFKIAKANGFKGQFLGVFPGNGGISISKKAIKKTENRNVIMIKGYEDRWGRALQIIEAIENIEISILQNFTILVYSAEDSVIEKIKKSKHFSQLTYKIYSRDAFLENQKLLENMGNSVLHIANSISDGMPNALLEAMGIGAFPIQSNPGKVSEEVITSGFNGYLIENPMDVEAISKLIKKALEEVELREKAQLYNVAFIDNHFNRSKLKLEIVALYDQIYSQK